MRKLVLSVLLLAPLVALGIYACDQQPVEPELNVADQQQGDVLAANVHTGNPFLGSWRATSAVLGDDELNVGTDLLYIITFRSDEDFSVSVSNDVDHLVCQDPDTSCEWDGPYWYTATTITLDESDHPDPDEANEDTHLYTRCGGTLFFLDFSDDGDVGIRITYQRTGLGR